ncbi:MAG: GAF domain-containing protein, partial [Chloroflexota bacterium]|nr:GAF domain-containing protein [Chloroflexota bacterium]
MFESIDLNSLQQADRLQTLNEIGRAVSSTLDLQTLYETIYQQIGRVMDTSQFFIGLHRPERGTIELPYLREQGALLVDQELPGGSSVTGLVIERGVALHFNSLEEYQLFGMMNGLKDIALGATDPEAMIFVPLSTGSRTIGALSVQSMRPHAYSQDDVQLLTILASQAAVAIENARLYAESQHNGRNMEALLRIAELINGSLDLQTVLDSLLVGIRDVIPYYLAAILLPDESRQYLEIVGAAGPNTKTRAQSVKIPVGKGVTGIVFESGKPLIVPDVHEFFGYIGPSRAVHSELAVPLTIGDTVVGVLNLDREQVNSFSPDELQLLSVFASQAAIAIENARLYASQQNRVSDLQTIQSIVRQLTPLHEIPAIAALINQELKLLIDYQICGIFERDETDGQLTPILYGGVDFPFEYLRPGEGLAGWVALHGEPAIVHDSSQDPRVAPIPGMQSGANSLISAPLNYEGRVRGVITLSKLGTNQFDENALRLLEIIAAQTAIAF